VTISHKPEAWKLSSPLVCDVDEIIRYGSIVSTKRIQYLANRRNRAVGMALGKYPETTHILMVDSYYLGQTAGLARLVSDYYSISLPMILGATIWINPRSRIRDYLSGGKIEFYDKWAVPDARFLPYGWKPQTDVISQYLVVPIKGLYPVCSVGACYIFPRSVWDSGVRYAPVEDLSGCEHNCLCKASGLKIYLDFNVALWRYQKYNFSKTVHVRAGFYKDKLLSYFRH
jgi:hypothetical protein